MSDYSVTVIDGDIIDLTVSAAPVINVEVFAGGAIPITGAASTIVTSNLPPDQLVISNSLGKIASIAVTPTEAGYLAGVTSGIQSQLNALSTAVATAQGDVDALTTVVAGKQDTISAGDRQLIYRNALGVIEGLPGFFQDATTGGLNLSLPLAPDALVGSLNMNFANVDINPVSNSPDGQVIFQGALIRFDANNSGFSFGTNGTAGRFHNNYFTHNGLGDIGELNFMTNAFDIGNGTDPITCRGLSYFYGFGSFHANVQVVGPLQGYGFQPAFDPAATVDPDACYITAFYDNLNAQGVTLGGYTGMNLGPHIGAIANNKNYNGLSVNPTIDDLQGNAGFYGIGVFGTVASSGTGGWTGIQINPQSVQAYYANGLYVSMNNVTVFPGVKASVTIQDLFYEADQPGEDPGNNITITYTPGATAGSEIVSNVGPAITVQIENGVSTATQIKAALDAYGIFVTNASVTIAGSGSNPQTVQGPTNLTGGQWPGQKQAAQFDGDVAINGSLSFSGALSIGKLSAFASQALVDGGGTPSSVHSLITQPTVAANVTIANADMLGVNTAALISIGDNAVVTTAFLGVAALGLPAVLTMGAGSTVDRVAGAVFALSLDAGAGGGTVDTVALCRALALPNGVTTVNRLYGYEFALPFGAIATDTWGVWLEPDVNNWMQGSLRLGGAAITDDKADTGFKMHVDGATLLEGNLSHTGSNVGFYAKSPVVQPTSAGAQTAGGTYGSTEQTMLQEVYDAVRAVGLMS